MSSHFLVDLEDQPGSLKNWPDWVSKILKLAEVEAVTRPALTKLLQSLDNTEVEQVEGTSNQCACSSISSLFLFRLL